MDYRRDKCELTRVLLVYNYNVMNFNRSSAPLTTFSTLATPFGKTRE